MAGLSPRQMLDVSAAITNASQSAIINFGVDLKTHFVSNSWLAPSNRYLVDFASKFDQDTLSSSLNFQDLGEYLAASVLTHTFDSWSYISNATSALLDGDYAESIHLSYYAELRAAMSILASSSIGVNNTRHFYFNSTTSIQHFGGQTHSVVWPLLVEWAKLQNNADRLLKSIRVDGNTIFDWLNAFSISIGRIGTPIVATQIFQRWGLDLNLISSDHTIRNHASYRPSSEAPRNQYPGQIQVMSHLLQIWDDCQPENVGSFKKIDLELLRSILEVTFEVNSGILQSDPRFLPSFNLEIDKLLHNLSITNSHTEAFLKRIQASNNCSVVSHAQSGFHSDLDIGGIHSRAFLMARIASALTGQYMRDCSIRWDELKFWWEPLGERLWLWPSGFTPSDMTDLWADVEVDTEAIWDTMTSGANWYRLISDNSKELFALRRFERAFLWAVGP